MAMLVITRGYLGNWMTDGSHRQKKAAQEKPNFVVN